MFRKLMGLTTACILLFSVMPAAAQVPVSLPPLSGPFPVGYTSYAWVDAARPEMLLPDTTAPREVVVGIHYPANPGRAAQHVSYAPGLVEDALGLFLPYPSDVIADNLLPQAYADAPLPRTPRTFPVVVFLVDVDSSPVYYTAWLEDLASQGYIVVSVSHPYSSQFTVFPDGRVAFAVEGGGRAALDTAASADSLGDVWVGDVRFVLDQLALLNQEDERFRRRLDMTRVAIIGDGFGGGVALSASLADNRLTAGISLDGMVVGDGREQGVSQPFMFMGETAPSTRRSQDTADERRHYDSAETAYQVDLPGEQPLKYASDRQFMEAVFNLGEGREATLPGGREAQIIRRYTAAFLDKHLRGAAVPLLDAPSPEFPEVVFERRGK
ncbi:MAG: hypothetical protein H6672_17975 [Anaerolineaceae bacterium]|nr:hypothetical protein [Anaerolineaceae bacterium]